MNSKPGESRRSKQSTEEADAGEFTSDVDLAIAIKKYVG
jgi:hypothetical protein